MDFPRHFQHRPAVVRPVEYPIQAAPEVASLVEELRLSRRPAASSPQTPERAARAANFVAQARRFLGQPFRWGGGHGGTLNPPGPVDCSGLVTQAARLVGAPFAGTATALQGQGREVPLAELAPGDLVFASTPALDVAISLGGGRVLHASRRQGKVVEADLAEAGAFDNARRMF